MIKKIVIPVALAAAVLILSAGCQKADLVGQYADTTYAALLEKGGLTVSSDADLNAWALTSPTGERFLWTQDSAAGKLDLIQEFDAAPFLDAGLKPEMLPDTYLYDAAAGLLQVTADLGETPYNYTGEKTPLSSFEQITANYRESIGYHEVLDHYGVAFGGGNMFEWAKDMTTNDKDMVFVLNPEPFIKAGVDPAAVEGWAFAKVQVKDASGKTEEVDKLLKPFELLK